MMSLSKSSCAKRMRCSLREIAFGLLCDPLATSKPCAAIIAARFTPEALRRATLLFGAFSPSRIQNKLTPKWEGPYGVIRVTRPGTVRMETEDGILVSNSWNIEHLCKFYP